MIYSRFGCEIEIVRYASVGDIESLEKRKVDENDRRNIRIGGVVVARYIEDGKLAAHHLSYMHADGGSLEIDAALRAADPDGWKRVHGGVVHAD